MCKITDILKERELAFFVWDISVEKPQITCGILRAVNAEMQTFVIHVYHDEEEKFEFSDFRKSVFPKSEIKAMQLLLEKLPKVGQQVYLVEEGKNAVTELVCNGYSFPNVSFKKGKKVPVTMAGKTFFLGKKEAEEAAKKAKTAKEAKTTNT